MLPVRTTHTGRKPRKSTIWLERSEFIDTILSRLYGMASDVPPSGPRPDFGLDLVESFIRPRLRNLFNSPPLGFGQVQDFPEEVPLDPWSSFRAWQYYSDYSYLAFKVRSWFPSAEHSSFLFPGEKLHAVNIPRETLSSPIRVEWSEWCAISRALNQRVNFAWHDWNQLERAVSDARFCFPSVDPVYSGELFPFVVAQSHQWLTQLQDQIIEYAQEIKNIPGKWHYHSPNSVPRHAIRCGDTQAIYQFLDSAFCESQAMEAKTGPTIEACDHLRSATRRTIALFRFGLTGEILEEFPGWKGPLPTSYFRLKIFAQQLLALLRTAETPSDDALSIVPPLSVIRDRITRNRREALVLRQLLKVATTRQKMLPDSPREAAHA